MDVDCRGHTNNSMSHFSCIYINVWHQLSILRIPFLDDHQCQILFLDEPTLGLDAQTRNHLWEYIKKLNKEEGMTVFFTTHYLEEAEKIADNIAIIDHGKIITKGTSNSIKKDTGSKTLEEAFLKLTGKHIREESASTKDQMRLRRRAWGR